MIDKCSAPNGDVRKCFFNEIATNKEIEAKAKEEAQKLVNIFESNHL